MFERPGVFQASHLNIQTPEHSKTPSLSSNTENFMKKLIGFADKLSTFGGVISGVMICLGGGVVICEIIARSLFHSTIYVAEEYAGYLMSGLTFAALGYTLREKGHIRMTFLRSALSAKKQVFLDMICFAVGFVFCLGLTYVTFWFFWDSVNSGSRSMQISETPLAIPQFFLPLGAFTMATQFLAEFLKNFHALKTGAYEHIQGEAKDLGH